MKKSEVQVIIPKDISSPPEPHEIEVAWILAKEYRTNVRFLKPIESYKVKTADFVFLGELWELKSPITKKRHRTVSRLLNKATAQANNIVFDARRTKLEDDYLQKEILNELRERRIIRKLIFITKDSKVIVLK